MELIVTVTMPYCYSPWTVTLPILTTTNILRKRPSFMIYPLLELAAFLITLSWSTNWVEEIVLFLHSQPHPILT